MCGWSLPHSRCRVQVKCIIQELPTSGSNTGSANHCVAVPSWKKLRLLGKKPFKSKEEICHVETFHLSIHLFKVNICSHFLVLLSPSYSLLRSLPSHCFLLVLSLCLFCPGSHLDSITVERETSTLLGSFNMSLGFDVAASFAAIYLCCFGISVKLLRDIPHGLKVAVSGDLLLVFCHAAAWSGEPRVGVGFNHNRTGICVKTHLYANTITISCWE